MRSDIRWVGFRHEIPWILILMVVGFASAVSGVMLALVLPDVPVWLSAFFILLPIFAFVGALFWVSKWRSRRRNRQLNIIATKLGMTFAAEMADDELLPPKDLPLMKIRRGQPRNLMSRETSGVKLYIFDLAAGGSKSTRDQTVAYFPDALSRLPDFPNGMFGWNLPKQYAIALHDFPGLTVEARAGRVIVYRWHHVVSPDSYPAFLALADQVYRTLTMISMAD